MTTYPLPTLAPTIDATGISAPSYADILASLQASFRSIFGSDIYIDPDSQDGQLLAIFAQAISDSNDAAIAVFNAFSPAKAQGAGLSSVVKINGLARLVPSASTVDLTISGTAGQVITGGQAGDPAIAGVVWNLPSTVTIGGGGSVVTTATANQAGNITAQPGTVTRILTPTRGWSSVTNVAAATPGAPTESDATLRQRQAISTAHPALTAMDAIIAEVANLAGVERYMAYENDTGSTDANGIPAHKISLVVQGGTTLDVATAIASKKAPGVGTYGTTSQVVIDPLGVSNTINFYRPTVKRILAEIDMTALAGFVSPTEDVIKAAVAAYVSGLAIGGDALRSKVGTTADLPGNLLGETYNITAVKLSISPSSPTTADVTIAFNEAANLAVADITLVVV